LHRTRRQWLRSFLLAAELDIVRQHIMEAQLEAPAFPFRRLLVPPLVLLVAPALALAIAIPAGLEINVHGLSGAIFAVCVIACLLTLAVLEIGTCARAAVLLNVWPALRTARNWFALAVGILSLVAVGGLVLRGLS
jgi:hypothetical protein